MFEDNFYNHRDGVAMGSPASTASQDKFPIGKQTHNPLSCLDLFITKAKKKNTLASGNVVYEKNFHPDCHKFIFFKSI